MSIDAPVRHSPFRHSPFRHSPAVWQHAPAARVRRSVALLAWVAASALCLPARAELVVHDAWMGAVPPTSKVGAVYLDIENTGDTAVSIGGAMSPAASRVELHQSVHSGDGRVRMEARESLDLEPGERVDFSATGHHYMLFFDVLPAPAPGATVPLSITVEGGAALDVNAAVRRPGEGGASATDHDHDHDHAAHGHGGEAGGNGGSTDGQGTPGHPTRHAH